MSFFDNPLPGQWNTESGNYDPSDPMGGGGGQTVNGMTQISGNGESVFTGPDGHEYVVLPNNQYQTLIGSNPQIASMIGGNTATSPGGQIGVRSDVAQQIGAMTSQPDMFSRMGPGILAMPFLAAAGGQMAFGGGFGGAGAATGGASTGMGSGIDPLSSFSGATPGSWASGVAAGDPLAGMDVGGSGLGATGFGTPSLGTPDVSNFLGTNNSAQNPSGGNWMTSLLGGQGSGSPNWMQYAAPILGAGIQAYGANQAANTMAGGANAANALYAPYLQAAGQAIPYMSSLAGVPGSAPLPANWMSSDPGYQFRLSQGQNAIQHQGSMSPSGNTLKALEDYTQGSASNEYQNIFNRVGALAGYGLPAASGSANALTGAANANAAGQAGVTNAITGGLSNIGNNWLISQLMQRLGQGAY